jgi:hypothetical protein
VPGPLAKHGRGNARQVIATTPSLENGKNSRRTITITEAITALTAVGALVFTGLSLNATRDQVAAAQQQNEVSEQRQYTDRYTNAVEQLDRSGAGHLQSRLGAIYALERLTRDSPRDQPTIIEILSAFVRTSRPTAQTAGGTWHCPAPQALSPDTKAALTVLGRRERAHDNDTVVDLSFICMNGVNLSGLDLRDVNLSGTDLRGAHMADVDLRHANLSAAYLTDAWVDKVDLRNALLRFAILSGAELFDTNLRKADLSSADLSDVSTGPSQGDVDLRNADLTYTNLKGAVLDDADLRGANLHGANHDERTDVQSTVTDVTTLGRWW